MQVGARVEVTLHRIAPCVFLPSLDYSRALPRPRDHATINLCFKHVLSKISGEMPRRALTFAFVSFRLPAFNLHQNKYSQETG